MYLYMYAPFFMCCVWGRKCLTCYIHQLLCHSCYYSLISFFIIISHFTLFYKILFYAMLCYPMLFHSTKYSKFHSIRFYIILLDRSVDDARLATRTLAILHAVSDRFPSVPYTEYYNDALNVFYMNSREVQSNSIF